VFTVADNLSLEQIDAPPHSDSQPPIFIGSARLNPKYTFSSFVVGSSNQLPHAASVAVANAVGLKYNPLFIYGGVGLGKTHLLHAIGNGVRGQYAGARICYISTEQFMNEFVSSLRNNKMETFRRRFRKDLDVLLMDDIQFIAGKDGTQDEFFHTFNSLYDGNKQIVLTSDKYPQEIPELEERLRSRFQWGLIADIQPPEFETRLAILRKKAEDEGIPLPNDVALYLADSIKSNVRELEGSLINLAAHASLENRRIDISFARETLKKVIALHQTSLTVESVQQTVCKHFNVSLSDLRGPRRHRSIAFPRQVAMYLCRKVLNSSYPELGEQFGGKDHTTALAACRKIERLVTEDVDVRSKVEALERLLHM
jgi:chromosomal replication initiator protein